MKRPGTKAAVREPGGHYGSTQCGQNVVVKQGGGSLHQQANFVGTFTQGSRQHAVKQILHRDQFRFLRVTDINAEGHAIGNGVDRAGSDLKPTHSQAQGIVIAGGGRRS
jgi:hypothetical protein